MNIFNPIYAWYKTRKRQRQQRTYNHNLTQYLHSIQPQNNKIKTRYPLAPLQKLVLTAAFTPTLISMGLVTVFGTLSLFAGPLALPFAFVVIAHTLFVTGFTFLVGIGYGIVNDLFAVRRNLPYFTHGHVNDDYETSLPDGVINSDNLNANAVAWGSVATWWIAAPFAVIFGIVTLVCDAVGVASASFMLPILGIAVLAGVFVIDAIARYCREHIIPKSFPREKASELDWLTNGYRNGIAYAVIPLVGLGGLITMIVLRAKNIMVPTFFVHMSLPVAFALQITLVAIPLLVLAAGLINVYRHHDERPPASEVASTSRSSFSYGKVVHSCYQRKNIQYHAELEAQNLTQKSLEHRENVVEPLIGADSQARAQTETRAVQRR